MGAPKNGSTLGPRASFDVSATLLPHYCSGYFRLGHRTLLHASKLLYLTFDRTYGGELCLAVGYVKYPGNNKNVGIDGVLRCGQTGRLY